MITARLAAKFNSYYAEKPVLTTMITNAVLGGIADTVAQSLTAYRLRSKSLPSSPSGKTEFISIEINEYGKEKPRHWGELMPARQTSAPFDFERLTRFMAYGFLMAPLQFKWFGFLSTTFPITKQRGGVPALQRVAMDQLVFAPIGNIPPSMSDNQS